MAVVDSIISDLVQGVSVLVSCKNGAHRSSILMCLILMRLTGLSAEQLMNYICSVRNIADFSSFPPFRQGRMQPSRPQDFLLKAEVAKAFAPVSPEPLARLHELLTPRQFTQRCLDMGFTSVPPANPQRALADAGAAAAGSAQGPPKKRAVPAASDAALTGGRGSVPGLPQVVAMDIDDSIRGGFTDVETVTSHDYEVVDLEVEAGSG